MQRLITKRDDWDFNKVVNEYLEAGWKVVPSTLALGVTAANGTRDGVELYKLLAVVVEKPDEPIKSETP